MVKLIVLILSMTFFSNLFAGFDNQQLSFLIGSINTSWSESSAELTVEDEDNVDEPQSGSSSALPLEATWEYYVSPKKSYFIRGSVPLIPTGADRYFFAGGGMNFYFKSISSKGSYRDAIVDLKFIPQWRYYWGLDAGLVFLVYGTGTQQKGDISAELGGHVGVIYTINQNWGAKIEAGYSLGNGVATSSNNIKVLLGATYYLKD